MIGARSGRASARRAACGLACRAAPRSFTRKGCKRASSATSAAREAAYPSAWWIAAWSGSPRVSAPGWTVSSYVYQKCPYLCVLSARAHLAFARASRDFRDYRLPIYKPEGEAEPAAGRVIFRVCVDSLIQSHVYDCTFCMHILGVLLAILCGIAFRTKLYDKEHPIYSDQTRTLRFTLRSRPYCRSEQRSRPGLAETWVPERSRAH